MDPTSQPDSAEEPIPEIPSEIPTFFRLPPWLLILGSLCTAITVIILVQALRWGDFITGLKAEAFLTTAFYAIPLTILIVGIQGILALIFMSKKRRAWWRTSIVILPSILIIGEQLSVVIAMIPPERRARNEIANHLGGEIPDSTQNITLDYSGGIDPGWVFEFTVQPVDFEKIKSYREYRTQGSGTLQHHDSSQSQFYYLDYDPATHRCKFQSLDY